jgi:hypothetical protein
MELVKNYSFNHIPDFDYYFEILNLIKNQSDQFILHYYLSLNLKFQEDHQLNL